MKKIFTILFFAIITIGFSQNDRKMERLKTLKVAFISDKLQLTTAEAQRFWPVYNAFDSEQMDLRFQKKMLLFQLRPENSSKLSDKDQSKLLTESELLEDKLQGNRKTFVRNLQGIIPVQKILLLKQIEDDFKQNLLKQLQNRRRD